MFGARNEVLDNIDQFCDLLLEKIFPKYLDQFKINNDYELFTKLVEDKENLTRGSVLYDFNLFVTPQKHSFLFFFKFK